MRSIIAFHRFIICLIIVMVATNLKAQDFSNKGKDFWVGYGSHVSMYNSSSGAVLSSGGTQDMVLYFTSDRNATVTVEIPSLNFIKTYQVKADSVTVSDPMPKITGQDARITAEGKSDKGIHITSDAAIIAYAHIYDGSISGATLLFPTNNLGRSYYSINYTQVSNRPYSYCYTYVIATEDSTNIEIVLSANTESGYKAGETIKVSLNKGQVYNIFGKVLTSSTNASTGEDLTGTLIRSVATATSSCKRIAVFSGSGKINISDNNSKTADNYIQQALPSSAWGKKYLTVPTAKMPTNIYRIAVSDPTTIVKLNGSALPISSLKNNFYYDITSSTANLIEANLPIMVAQYITTTGSYGNINGGNGDPEMIYLSPIEQTINKVTINSTPFDKIVDSLHFVNIILPKASAASLRVDGNAPKNQIIHPADNNFVYYQVALKAGSHTIVSDSGFNAIAYGYGSVESYGYNAGTNVVDLYQKLTVDNQYGNVKLPATCKRTPFKVSITLPYQPLSLIWNIPKYSNIAPDYAPKYDSSYIVNGKTIYRYSLPNYLTYDSVGTYTIQLKVNNPTLDGCSGEQNIDFDLVVYDPPKAASKIDFSNCLNDSLYLTDNTILGPDDRKLIGFNWKVGTESFVNAKQYTTSVKVAGVVPVKYFVITDIGCLSDTITSNIIVDSIPKVDFNIQKITCVNKDVQFTDSSFARQGTSLVKWLWNYGDNKAKDSSNTSSAVIHQFDTVKTYTVQLAVTTTNGCIAQKIKSVTINPIPIVGYQLPKICLNDAYAEFIDTSTIVDNSKNFKHLWNFGDPSNTTVSNTDTVANPKHRYLNPGTYQVNEQVTSIKGCVSDKTQTFTVNGSSPKSNFEIIDSNALCTNKPVQLKNTSTVDLGNIGKLVVYWDYYNNPLDTTMDDNPLQNKIYNHSYSNFQVPNKMNFGIKLAAYSGITCYDDHQSAINLVTPPQSFSFTTSNSYLCVADSVLFEPIVTGGVAPYTYDWSSSNSTLANFSNSYLKGFVNGSVNVDVAVKDSKNCIYPYINIKTLEIKDIPKVSIMALDTNICNQDPILLVGTGSVIHKWYNDNSLFTTSNSDTLSTIIPGKYQLKVNDGFCNSLISNSIQVKQHIIPKFTINNTKYICINAPVKILTNTVEASGAHFNWNFGDSQTSVKAQPIAHNYNKFGQYQIKLTYTNDFCPRYDTSAVGDSIRVINPLQPAEFTMFVLSDIDTLLTNIKVDSGYTQYSWYPNTNLNNTLVPYPVFRGIKTTDYTLTRTDTASSCQIADIYHIIVSNDVVVAIPLAFTPNNDGLNDYLRIEHGAGLKTFNYFKLFNRWGKIVFETTDVNAAWDGKYNNLEQEVDSYTYLIDYITFKDEHIKKTGSVILLR